jgi:hypothetical protein
VTVASLRSIVCVVCGDAFSYPYTGGRNRKTCDRPECVMARSAQNKRRERDTRKTRSDGYRPADYPVAVDYGLPPPEELELLVEVTYHYRIRRKLREQADSVGGDRRTNDALPEDHGTGAIMSAGHGYLMEDFRSRDSFPLRFIPRNLRGEVKQWYSDNGFPIAGSAGASILPGEGTMYVMGRLETPAEVPRRITRRFCSMNALPPLAPFTMTV